MRVRECAVNQSVALDANSLDVRVSFSGDGDRLDVMLGEWKPLQTHRASAGLPGWEMLSFLSLFPVRDLNGD